MKLAPGTLFARDFRVVSTLAEGGMGALYVVEQLSTGRRRALKIMLAALVPDARARERFLLEARIGSQIASEHVVDVVASGVDEASGTPWIAMELLEGKDLAAFVAARGLLSTSEAWEVLSQLAEGLAAAHAQGIVHRDLKPENVFVSTTKRRGAPFLVKILDFGISKIRRAGQTSATATSAMGSPIWMAPEQADAGARLRPSTDVWALGLIAYWLLTGKSYWRAANEPSFTLPAVLSEVLVLPMEPPSVRAAELGMGARIPPGFDAWFARSVARDHEARFTDARAAIDALAPSFTSDVHAPPAGSRAPTYASTPISAPASRADVEAQLPSSRSVPATLARRVAPAPTLAMEPPTPARLHAPASSGLPPPPTSGPSIERSPRASRRHDRMRWFLVGAGVALVGLVGVMSVAVALLVLPRAQVSDVRTSGARPDALPPPLAIDDAGATALVDATPVEPLLGGSDAGPSDAPPADPSAVVTNAPREPLRPSTRDRASEPADLRDDLFPEGRTRRFAGTWTHAGGWRTRVTLALTRAGASVRGSIRWTLTASPDPLYAARIGESATELVVGSLPSPQLLVLDGQSVTDPTLIATDHYELRVGRDGSLEGTPRAGGGHLVARLLE